MVDPNKPKVPEVPEDKSIFKGRKNVPTQEFIWKITKGPPTIPDSGGAMYPESKRREIAKEITKKFGTIFEDWERKKLLKDLEKQKAQSKTSAEKLEKDRLIRYLKRDDILGKK